MCFWLFHVSLPVIDNPICQNLEYWVSSRNSGTWLSFYFRPFWADGTSKSQAGGGGGGFSIRVCRPQFQDVAEG